MAIEVHRPQRGGREDKRARLVPVPNQPWFAHALAAITKTPADLRKALAQERPAHEHPGRRDRAYDEVARHAAAIDVQVPAILDPPPKQAGRPSTDSGRRVSIADAFLRQLRDVRWRRRRRG